MVRIEAIIKLKVIRNAYAELKSLLKNLLKLLNLSFFSEEI